MTKQSQPSPPGWADRLLEWFVAPHLLEYVQGDLHETFHKQVELMGPARARRAYVRAVFHCLTPFFYQRKDHSPYPKPALIDMLRSYFLIARRNLVKNKLYTGINVFGLALGMACTLLISLWVKDELSYNRFLPNAESVYFVRVNFTHPSSGEIGTNFVTPGPLQQAIAKDVPEVAAVTKINPWAELLIKVGETSVKEKGYFATDDFFSVFDLPAVKGSPKAALAQTNQIVITQRVAEKFFPKGEALGKTLQLDNDKFYVVGAVLKNLPSTSTLQFDWIVNWKVQDQPWHQSWGNNSFLTYLRLKPNTTVAQTEASMKSIYPRYAKERTDAGAPILQPITDVYLYGDYHMGKPVGGRIEYVRVFSLVAGFILLIACINFMNLATARSSTRAREVGVRKVVGALRSSLIGQFLSESILTSALAVGLAVGLVWAMLPLFNSLFGKQLALNLADPIFWGILGILVLITGFLSGSYPALFLSSLQPIKILKGRLQFGAGPALFRRTLVVFQFSLSVFLIVGMLAVGKQMNYLRTKHLGLDRENVVYLSLEGAIAQPEKVEAYRQAVLRQPSVISAAEAGQLPINIQSTSGDLKWPGKDPKLEITVTAMAVGTDFARTMNIKLLEGREFRHSLADTASYLINEATAKQMGMKNPVGKEVTFWMGRGRVVGLLKDFHMNSLHQAITPLVLTYIPGNSSYLLVKTRAGQTTQALADLERVTKEFNPNYPFTYHFLDEEYESLYRSEQQVSALVNYFGILAILISCLGLFGLAAFTAEQRTKEIGVRKVLGASVPNIVTLLSTDFLKLVLIALVLASPLAWWALNNWLETFAYRTDLAWWIFALSGAVALVIALFTVSFQAIKAALTNPVKSLRAE